MQFHIIVLYALSIRLLFAHVLYGDHVHSNCIHDDVKHMYAISKWSHINYGVGQLYHKNSILKPNGVAVSNKQINTRRLQTSNNNLTDGYYLVDSSTPANPSFSVTADSSVVLNTSSIAIQTFQPIRIALFSTDLQSGLGSNTSLYNYIVDDVLASSINWLQFTLQVTRVSSNLKLSRSCDSFWISNNKSESVCASIDPSYNVCGMATVPDSHFDTIQVCESSPTNCQTVSGGAGVTDADFIMYATAKNDETYCTGQTLGFGGICFRDQNDRPIAGHFNFCPKVLSTQLTSSSFIVSNAQFKSNVAFVVHEFIHALGFTSDSFAFFRDLKGAPLTTRGDNGLPPYSDDWGGYMPSSAVVSESTLSNGKVVRVLRTPAVLDAVKAHSGCSSLQGAELEDEGGRMTKGSHWERRVWFQEALIGALGASPTFSKLTLAAFEDSSWYVPNYANAGNFTWGSSSSFSEENALVASTSALSGASASDDANSAACQFYNPSVPCLEAVSGSGGLSATPSVSAEHYCSKESQVDNCSFDFKGRSRCQIGESTDILPEAYRYFPSRPRYGGTLSFTDACPIESHYSIDSSSSSSASTTTSTNSLCTDVGNDLQSRKFLGELLGTDSRCVVSSLTDPFLATSSSTESRCLERRCIVDASLSSTRNLAFSAVDFRAWVASQAVTAEIRCYSDEIGSQKSSWSMQGYITCPSLQRMCADFPCSNGGHWAYHMCVCPPGFIGRRCEHASTSVNRLKIPNRLRFEPAIGMRLGVGQRVSFQAKVDGDILLSNSTYKWRFTPVTCLPAGLQLNSNTGELHGVPITVSACKSHTISAALVKTNSTTSVTVEEARTVLHLEVVQSLSSARTLDSSAQRRSQCAFEVTSITASTVEINSAAALKSSDIDGYTCINVDTGTLADSLGGMIGSSFISSNLAATKNLKSTFANSSASSMTSVNPLVSFETELTPFDVASTIQERMAEGKVTTLSSTGTTSTTTSYSSDCSSSSGTANNCVVRSEGNERDVPSAAGLAADSQGATDISWLQIF